MNGNKVREAELSDGDIIEIGKFSFRFHPGLPPVPVEPGRPAPPSLYDRAPRAAIYIDGAEMPITFDDRCMIIGRRSTCDIPLLEESASTTHAIIYEFNGKRFVRDLGSRTGTFVDGRKINDQAELKLGAELKVGDTEMRYDVVGPPEDDDLEHLVGTAPLGDMLDLIAKSAPAAPEAQTLKEQRQPEPVDEGDDAERLPIEIDEPAPFAQPTPVAAPESIPLDRDEVDLDEETESGDANATHAIPVEKPAAPKVARQPNLATDPDEQITEPLPQAPEDAEGAEDNLVEMRRGWRGLSPTLPSDTDEAIESPKVPAESEIAESADALAGQEPVADASVVEALNVEAPEAVEEEEQTPDAVRVETDRIEIASPDLEAEPDAVEAVVEPDTQIERPHQPRDESPTEAEATEIDASPVPVEVPVSEDEDAAGILSRSEPSPDELRLDLPSESEIESDLPPVDLSLGGELVDDAPSELAQPLKFDEPAVIDLTPPLDDAEDDESAIAAPISDVVTESPSPDARETVDVTDEAQVVTPEESEESLAAETAASDSDIATPPLSLDSTEPSPAGEKVSAPDGRCSGR